MRVLIFGTSYVEGQHARYLFSLWLDLVRKLNPTADVLVVDSASPDLPPVEDVTVLALDGNIGHLGKNGVDGWGRAFSAGLNHAVKCQYDYAVHIETDLLFARPVLSSLARMKDHGIKVAAPMALPYAFIETALMFFDVGYVRDSKLVGRYNWEGSPVLPHPEVRLGAMTQAELFGLPLYGLRNDHGQVTPKNMAQLFPCGIDWITHCKDPAVYREFLKVNGHG